jgi:hypothetical protein
LNSPGSRGCGSKKGGRWHWRWAALHEKEEEEEEEEEEVTRNKASLLDICRVKRLMKKVEMTAKVGRQKAHSQSGNSPQ